MPHADLALHRLRLQGLWAHAEGARKSAREGDEEDD